jgi:Beta/Gamma crystallin
MLNIKEYFNQLDAIAVKELEDEVAATCSGGALTTSGVAPSADVTLWENGPFAKGDTLSLIGFQKGDGISNLGAFNDKTSSIRINRGRWAFYKDDRFRSQQAILGPGSYPVPSRQGIANDSLSSLLRVG